MSVLPSLANDCEMTVIMLGEDDMLYTSKSREVSTDPRWKPPLKLSAKQRQVKVESGTVLLLGRSGTGKTLCLCDRMTTERSEAAVRVSQQETVRVCTRLSAAVRRRGLSEKHALHDAGLFHLTDDHQRQDGPRPEQQAVCGVE
jgi:hypothetical protein